MIEHPFLVFDDDGRLQSDLSCIGCGYNLRTLREDDRCPECGSHVTATLAQLPLWGISAKLWTADPQWVLSLRRGFGRWCVCTLVGVVMFLIVVIPSQFVFYSGLPLTLHAMLAVVWCMPWLVIGWGSWQATVGPKHDMQSAAWRVGRFLCRAGAVTRVLLWLVIGLNMLTDGVVYGFYIGYDAESVSFVILLIELIAWWSLLLYLRPLVRTLLPTAMAMWWLAVGGGAVAGVTTCMFVSLQYMQRWGWHYGPAGYFMQDWWWTLEESLVFSMIPAGLLWLGWIYALTWMLWRTLRRFRNVEI